MANIGNIPEILEVKKCLEALERAGDVKKWELPYENILTRLSAGIFFLTPASEDRLTAIWDKLSQFEFFSYCKNSAKKLSDLDYMITFKQNKDGI